MAEVMDIKVSGIWTNSYNFVKNKITDGLTPLERKVVMAFAAFLALATVGFLCYACYRKLTQKVTTSDNRSTQTKIPNQPAQTDPIKTANALPSEADIAIRNADEIRARIDQPPETIRPLFPQWRKIYFDASGNFLGVKGPSNLSKWMDDKELPPSGLIAVELWMQKFQWDPSKRPELFTYQEKDLETQSPRIRNIVRSTVNELNQFALGAYHLAQANPQNVTQQNKLMGDAWLTTYFNDTENYPAAILYDAKTKAISVPPQSKQNTPAPSDLPPTDDTKQKKVNDQVQKGDPINKASLTPTEKDIVKLNVEHIRDLIERNNTETPNPSGEQRELYFDAVGHFWGVKGGDSLSNWVIDWPDKSDLRRLKEPDKSDLRPLKLNCYISRWDPKKRPNAFTYNEKDLEEYSDDDINQNIVKSTIYELNQLALGAYNLCRANQTRDPTGSAWMHDYFMNPKEFPTAMLYKAI